MTKKVFMSALIAVVLLVAGYTGYKTMPVSEESNLLLDNVEALARGEAAPLTITCYSSWTGEDGKKADLTVYKCYPCGKEVKCVSASNKEECYPK